MVSDWRRDAGFGVYPAGADDLHLRAGVQQRVNAGTANLADPDMLHAIWLTVLIALIAVPVNLVFGILLAWLVTRFNFPDVSYC